MSNIDNLAPIDQLELVKYLEDKTENPDFECTICMDSMICKNTTCAQCKYCYCLDCINNFEDRSFAVNGADIEKDRTLYYKPMLVAIKYKCPRCRFINRINLDNFTKNEILQLNLKDYSDGLYKSQDMKHLRELPYSLDVLNKTNEDQALLIQVLKKKQNDAVLARNALYELEKSISKINENTTKTNENVLKANTAILHQFNHIKGVEQIKKDLYDDLMYEISKSKKITKKEKRLLLILEKSKMKIITSNVNGSIENNEQVFNISYAIK